MKKLYNLINVNLDRKEMICIVGAGGKTSVLFQLAGELLAEGKKVLVTTTTAIFQPKQSEFAEVVITEEEDLGIFLGIQNNSITVLGRSLSSENKLLGVNPKFLNDVLNADIFDYILIEGDGSKGRPVKAPAEHEPVIPSGTTKVLGVIGMDCIGKEVSSANVHRPELFCKVVDCCEGSLIDLNMILKLILSTEGLFKAVPKQTQRILILNKADGEKELTEAFAIAQMLQAYSYKPEEIVISSMRSLSFQNAVRRISGIILASGLSRRMGADKLLLPIEGIPVIERIIAAACDSRLWEVILVCTSEDIAAIGRKYGVKIVNNNSPESGQSQSVRLGVMNSRTDADGFMFLVGDQPYITDNIINKLITRFIPENCNVVIPQYNGNKGNPAIFSNSQKEKLLSIRGDVGGRVLIKELSEGIIIVDFRDALAGYDFDTPEEYEAVHKLEDKNG